MVHETLQKFGYPETLIHEYDHWAVVLRPAQATLGALVLIAKSDAIHYSHLPPAAFAEMHTVIEDIESVLGALFDYDKVNYLMLMMVDPQVHYHVLPRYEGARDFSGVTCADPGWPGPPDLGAAIDFDDDRMKTLQTRLREHWPRASDTALDG